MTTSSSHLQPFHQENLRGRSYAASITSTTESLLSNIASIREDLSSSYKWKYSPWRHTLGIALLLVTVFLWTLSNFLASTIFADNTYSKPYFVTYINSSFFVIPLAPMLLKKWTESPQEIYEFLDAIRSRRKMYSAISNRDEEEDDDPNAKSYHSHIDRDESGETSSRPSPYDVLPDGAPTAASILSPSSNKLSLLETFKLALPFGFLWYFANYSSVACLEYTTVGSATILTSTSSIWTLIIGAFMSVERFTVRKLLGVLASLSGIILISTIDIGGGDDQDRGSFPHKTAREIAIGDALAFGSSVIYGIYIVVLKRRIGDESRVDMPIFFGMVGLLNLIFMWPGFIFLHLIGTEPFAFPTSLRVVIIIIVNSTSSLISDFCWAFAMLLTSPLVVTVGISLTIPLSLVGQMIISGVYSGWMYWFGAAIVVGSFVFINHEESKDEEVQNSGILEISRSSF